MIINMSWRNIINTKKYKNSMEKQDEPATNIFLLYCSHQDLSVI